MTLLPSPIVARNFLGSKSRFLAGTGDALNDSPGVATLPNILPEFKSQSVHFCTEWGRYPSGVK